MLIYGINIKKKLLKWNQSKNTLTFNLIHFSFVHQDEKVAEFNWVVGPIPIEDGGKEIIAKYSSGKILVWLERMWVCYIYCIDVL